MTNRIDPKLITGVRAKPDQGRSQSVQENGNSEQIGFDDLLKEAKLNQVQFSKHAAKRIESRSIEMNKDDLALLSDGINRAQAKGSKESLLLMGGNAFVVNVTDRTVITAVDEEGMKEKTFTNIDSAILINKK